MTRAALIAAVALGGAAAACGAEGGAPAPVVVYTAFELDELAALKPIVAAALPDVPVAWVRDSGGVIATRLAAEREAPKAEVLWGVAGTTMVELDDDGLLMPLPEGAAAAVDSAFVDAENTPPRWFGFKLWTAVPVFNAQAVRDGRVAPPASWRELAAGRYRGRLLVPDPASSGTGFLLVAGLLQHFGTAAGEGVVAGLRDAAAALTHSGSKAGRLTADGEFDGAVTIGVRAAALAAEGLVVVPPFAEGAAWDVEAAALVRRPVVREAARRLVRFAGSEAAFALYARTAPTLRRGDPLPPRLNQSPAVAARDRDRILRWWAAREAARNAAAAAP